MWAFTNILGGSRWGQARGAARNCGKLSYIEGVGYDNDVLSHSVVLSEK